MSTRPLVGVTIGDPAGVGPEVVARALTNPSLHASARLLVFGSGSVMKKALALIGHKAALHSVQAPGDGVFAPGTIDLLEPAAADPGAFQPGAVQAQTGRAAYLYFARAIAMAMAGEIDAIATAPLNKEALRAAGVPYLDHTAMLAQLADSPEPMTLFVLDNMRIFFLTRHISLAEACRQVTAERLLIAIRRADGELRRLGMPSPRIAVAGLNPHSGEGGLFGEEEIREIGPAVARARDEGINAFGPVPADSVFSLNLQGRYDAVLSLYHDQGHIAAKTRDFERTVSVTVGIPFVRTSVDHGTAFDIAWKGTASAISMEEAIKVAATYAQLVRRSAS